MHHNRQEMLFQLWQALQLHLPKLLGTVVLPVHGQRQWDMLPWQCLTPIESRRSSLQLDFDCASASSMPDAHTMETQLWAEPTLKVKG